MKKENLENFKPSTEPIMHRVDHTPVVVYNKKRVYATPNNFMIRKEVPRGKSMTVPDQTLSIKEIMLRHSRGIPMDNVKGEVYHGEDELFPDYRKLDLAEIQELQEENAREIADAKAEIQRQKKQRHNKALEQIKLDLEKEKSSKDEKPKE